MFLVVTDYNGRELDKNSTLLKQNMVCWLLFTSEIILRVVR